MLHLSTSNSYSRRNCKTMRSPVYGTSIQGSLFVRLLPFFELSNLVPNSIAERSPLKHLTREDIIFDKKAIVIVKWSKTIQTPNSAKVVYIPILNNDICPVTAIRNVLARICHYSNKKSNSLGSYDRC